MTSTITNTSPVPLAGENCTNAQNLALLTSPYSATTAGYADDISICRTGFGDRIFFISVPNGSTLSIGESTNGYDEWEYVGYGATCPGTTTINCWDNDALAQTVWTNSTGSAQTVWYIQDGYSGTGTFTLQWSITTPPACAGAPTAPSDGATGIPTAGTTLSWPSVATATGYDVYFGTTTPAPTLVSSNQAGTTYATGALSGGTTYYWRIVPRNAAGPATGCANWSFATAVVGCTNASFYPATPFAAPAPGDATYTITTCQYQSEYNQMTGAVAGNTFISTAGIAGTYITVRAGAVGGTVVADGITPLSWTAAAGGTYFIHYNTNSSCGTASTCMTSTIQNTTSNDLCGNAFNIGSLPYTSAIISNATMTDDVAASTCDGPYKNIWWKVTGVCGTMTAITCTGGTNFDDEIAVFTGSCGSFTQVACNDDNGAGCTSNYAGVSWTSTAGTVYYITVGSYYNAGPTGNIQLNVTGGDVTAPSITCPAAQSPCSATMPNYTGLATGVSDNCTATGSIVITQSPAAGSALALGNTTVTLTATDAANNFAQCTFTVSRPDADGDGTADCDDGCPNDPNKIVPGQCGCGVADTDTDGDGTANCNDGCPNDPLKIAAGVCGCGVADTDTDGDGTANCIDGCPNDAKIAPGSVRLRSLTPTPTVMARPTASTAAPTGEAAGVWLRCRVGPDLRGSRLQRLVPRDPLKSPGTAVRCGV
ncbi:MAG: HYR domain-containing protein [Flavobacteriales bacterium]|nr:HYR domain-containing protein [Flavobacteriales bacterium]